MKFDNPLVCATILKRYNRFLCDVILNDNGEKVTAHCPNSGSMKGIPLNNAPVMLSSCDSSNRKLKYTLEMVFNGSVWIGANTLRTNKIAREGIELGFIGELYPFTNIKSEVNYGQNSRIDFVVQQTGNICYVEVKNVSLVENNTAKFPDSVTQRGQKHIVELMKMKKYGYRAVTLFIIQREDCASFSPAADIDAQYSKLLSYAVDEGVEVYAYQAKVTPQEIRIIRKLPVRLICSSK